jgi:hypothetical protein
MMQRHMGKVGETWTVVALQCARAYTIKKEKSMVQERKSVKVISAEKLQHTDRDGEKDERQQT